MKVTNNPVRTKMVGKRPAQYARLVYRVCEKNLVGNHLEEFYAAYAQGVRRDELLPYEELFGTGYIEERYWINILLFALREDIMGSRLAVLLAPYHKVETAGPFAAMMLTASSIRGFIEPMVRYQPALDPTLIMGREEIPGGVRIIAHYDGLEGEVAQCFIYAGLYMLEDAMQRMALWKGEVATTIKVNAPQPSYFESVRDMFYSEVYWENDVKRMGSGWSIDIPDELLDIPNYCFNRPAHEELKKRMEESIRAGAAKAAESVKAGESGGPQTELVRTTLSTALTLLSQAQVSTRVRCEPRTLQKRLQKEGTSWSELITDEFKKRTEPAVVRGEACKDLAKRMGMTESNFYRKFQKLYGETPKQWLLSQQEGRSQNATA